MATDTDIRIFLSKYDDHVSGCILKLREVLLENLPDVEEQIDVPAKMIAYCYGRKYAEMVCTLFPSRKGLKLGFYKGVDLPDPDHLLEGNGKVSRYVDIRELADADSGALRALMRAAFEAYKERNGK